jgi:hypothetical protein
LSLRFANQKMISLAGGVSVMLGAEMLTVPILWQQAQCSA